MNDGTVLLEPDAASDIATFTRNRPRALKVLDMAIADGLRAFVARQNPWSPEN